MHESKGGPIKKTNGVEEFYKNKDSRQIFKCMLWHIADSLPAKEYPCISINLMWEIYCGIHFKGGMDWAVEMCKYWQDYLNDSRSIGFGSPFISHLVELNNRITRPGEIYSEAYDFEKFLQVNHGFSVGEIRRLNITFYGYWAGGESLYWNSKGNYPEAREYFSPGNESRNAARAIKNMFQMVKYHINPSFPFKQEVYGGSVIKNWWYDRAGIDVSMYDFEKVRYQIMIYADSERFQACLNNPTEKNLKALRAYTTKAVRALSK